MDIIYQLRKGLAIFNQFSANKNVVLGFFLEEDTLLFSPFCFFFTICIRGRVEGGGGPTHSCGDHKSCKICPRQKHLMMDAFKAMAQNDYGKFVKRQ